MIQPLFNGMLAILLAKFLINDLPHAAGLTGTPAKALLTPGQFVGNPLHLDELDPAVRDLVAALNAAGYTTKGSCEGHLLITGRITNAYIEFISGVIKTSEDRQRVREIVTSYTSTPIMWLRSDEVRFRGSLREKPTASPPDALGLLADLEKGGGGPGRSVEKILSMYDVEDLKEMARLYSSSPDYDRPPTTAQLRYIAGLRQRLKMTITYERQVVTFGEAGRMIRELEAEERDRKGLKELKSGNPQSGSRKKIIEPFNIHLDAFWEHDLKEVERMIGKLDADSLKKLYGCTITITNRPMFPHPVTGELMAGDTRYHQGKPYLIILGSKPTPRILYHEVAHYIGIGDEAQAMEFARRKEEEMLKGSNPTVRVETNEEVSQNRVSGVAIAWVGSKDVGSLHYELEVNGTGEILFMQVDEEYRGLGVGKKMYCAVETLAERYEVKKLTAEVGIPGYGDIERAKRFWGSVGFTITNDYAEKELKGSSPSTAVGTCYEDAWRFLIKQGEGYLVHGSVRLYEGGREVKHAWVELPTGQVWEPQTKSYFSLKDFEITSPIEEHRYTVEEAAIMVARAGNHGPWTDEERMKWIGRS